MSNRFWLIKQTYTGFSGKQDDTVPPKGYRAHFYPIYSRVVAIIMAFSVFSTPTMASASILSIFTRTVSAEAGERFLSQETNSQKMAVVTPSVGPESLSKNKDKKAGTELYIEETVLVASMGPLGSPLDVAELPELGQMSIYTVRKGDTIGEIAEMFDVTVATILTANNIGNGKSLKVGTELVILPMSGFNHKVSRGDTLSAISKKYGIDSKDILFYNDMQADDPLVIGMTLLIPDPDFSGVPVTPSRPSSGSSSGTTSTGKTTLGSLIARPVPGIRTQGFHGYMGSAVDIGTPIGTSVRAAYDGTVVVAKSSGWNGGYGKFIVIDHTIQGRYVRTIYAHLSSVDVIPGQKVSRAEFIGRTGSTGNSTGPHIHWEVRGSGISNPVGVNRSYGLNEF